MTRSAVGGRAGGVPGSGPTSRTAPASPCASPPGCNGQGAIRALLRSRTECILLPGSQLPSPGLRRTCFLRLETGESPKAGSSPRAEPAPGRLSWTSTARSGRVWKREPLRLQKTFDDAKKVCGSVRGRGSLTNALSYAFSSARCWHPADRWDFAYNRCL